jgi:hypothetical protein
LQLGTRVAKPDLAPESPSGELQLGQGIDHNGIRVDECAHIADDHIDVAALQQRANALAERRHIGAIYRTDDGQDDRSRPGRRLQRTHRVVGDCSGAANADLLSLSCFNRDRLAGRNSSAIISRTVARGAALVLVGELNRPIKPGDPGEFDRAAPS